MLVLSIHIDSLWYVCFAFRMTKSENVSSPKVTAIEIPSDEEDENLTYAQLRDKRMKENINLLE